MIFQSNSLNVSQGFFRRHPSVWYFNTLYVHLAKVNSSR